MTSKEPKHDRNWIVGCIKHDGFIKTDRGDKANQIILEALQVEPKTGEWVATHIGETTSWYVECSECHVVMPPVNYSYCPNCGAKMDKEIEDNGTE